jgi:UDP-N-acetylglucosamine:LPS N-acetylglucosamine transferase
MIIGADFYRAVALDRQAERSRLGLDPQRLTGMVLFGGQGSSVMQTLARQLPVTQLILACGHHQALAQRLRRMNSSAPRVVVGFTQQIQHYMQLSDFMIGKPGPGSISEAVQQRLPVIVVRNSWTMPQERYNTQWVRENNAGLVLPGFRHLDQAVIEMAARLEEFRASIAQQRNQAVFEIPEILAGILKAHQAQRALQRAPSSSLRATVAYH